MEGEPNLTKSNKMSLRNLKSKVGIKLSSPSGDPEVTKRTDNGLLAKRASKSRIQVDKTGTGEDHADTRGDDDSVFGQIFAANEGRLHDQSAANHRAQGILSHRHIGPSQAHRLPEAERELGINYGFKPDSKLLSLHNARAQTSTSENDVDAALDFINENPVRFPGVWDGRNNDPQTIDLRPMLAGRESVSRHQKANVNGSPTMDMRDHMNLPVPRLSQQSQSQEFAVAQRGHGASLVTDDGSRISSQVKLEHEPWLSPKTNPRTNHGLDESLANEPNSPPKLLSPRSSDRESLPNAPSSDKASVVTEDGSQVSFGRKPEHEELLASTLRAVHYKPAPSASTEIDHSKHPAFASKGADTQVVAPNVGVEPTRDAWWLKDASEEPEDPDASTQVLQPDPLRIEKTKAKSEVKPEINDFRTLTRYRKFKSAEVSEPTDDTVAQGSVLTDKQVSSVLRSTQPHKERLASPPMREVTPVAKGKKKLASELDQVNTSTSPNSQHTTPNKITFKEPEVDRIETISPRRTTHQDTTFEEPDIGDITSPTPATPQNAASEETEVDHITSPTREMTSPKTTPTKKRFLNSIKTSITAPLASKFSFGTPGNVTNAATSPPTPATQYFQRFPFHIRSPREDIDNARRPHSPALQRYLDEVRAPPKENYSEAYLKPEVEKIRTYTGTRAIFRDAANPTLNHTKHPNHFRVWDSKNLCCFFHHENCELCGAPCCAFTGAQQVIKAHTTLPEEKTLAAKTIADVNNWYPISDEADTFVKCSTCRKLRCPKCSGICSDPLCRLPKCEACTPQIWGPCHDHRDSRISLKKK